MIKLPKEINKALQRIESAGYEAYVTGEAVCRSLVGQEPLDWEIITTASMEKVEEIFEETGRDGENETVIYAAVGEYEFAVTCENHIEEGLRKKGFTISAMADNPARTFLDPANGKKDMSDKLVRVISEPKEYFTKNPAMILRGIALAADLDFDIEMETFTAMKETVRGLGELKIEVIRDGFGEILTAKSAARGLRFSVAAGVMPFVLGEECYSSASKHETDQFNILMEKYDEVRPELEYRYPMLFLCFEDKKAVAAIRRLHFDKESNDKYTSTVKKTQELYFIASPYRFKKFLYLNGWDNYQYWNNVTKQQRKVYDQPDNRILSRYYMKQEFDALKMAVFIEDLAINGEDLKAIGVPEEKVDLILEKLLYMIHYKPRLNTREYLMSEAKRQNRNPFVKFLRDVHFMK